MNSLNDICYEEIKDSFHHGLFGDFKLVIDKNTGCFNATKLCNLGGKKFYHWNLLEKSKNLVNYIKNTRTRDSVVGFYEVKGDNNDYITKKITGQYVPKEIILDIASWISIEFYMKCNDIIINYHTEEFKNLSDEAVENKIKKIEDNYKNIVEEKEVEISDLNSKLNNIIDQNNKILETNKKLEYQNNTVIETNKNLESQNRELLYLARKQNIKLDSIENELEDTNYKLDALTETVEENILPDRNISPNDDKLKHNLAIYKHNEEIRIIRAQNKLSANRLKNVDTKDVIVNEYVPNPIDFINRMKLKCNSVNKEIKKKLKISNRNMNYDEFNELYDENKLFEIKYSHILLNNSNLNDIVDCFNLLKKEQYDY
ncbi:N1R/p28-like protein [Mythimna separata entomopoxvirus 'L']|uniref:N1R/p28-like protein n=1 Tax=Mythimna separata entomopoxvirus 'L' TaxID=1293572 RepID=A0A916KQD4_9POXV|nr:N1R/p28-like protein [Mythimna separata entomopoxvirus 'L']CCU56256.1 N1R/p28-like protein [Mythimna separata entomopoxvirus 'L']